MTRQFGLAAAAALLAAPAAAETVELSYGAAFTSNYIYRGTSQSDDRPAVQTYLEAGFGEIYLGAWASTVRLDDDRAEFNLYAGIRRSVGALDYDFGYVRYLYDDSGDCCGELYLAVDHAVGDDVGAGATIFWDPEEATAWLEGRAFWAFAPAWSADATLGTDFGTLNLDRGDKRAWTVGVTRELLSGVAGDLRYADSNDDPSRIVATLTFDF